MTQLKRFPFLTHAPILWYASLLQNRNVGPKHAACTEEKCVGNILVLASFRTEHTSEGRTCDFL